MVVPITDVVKMTLSVADISVEPIIGTPLVANYVTENPPYSHNSCLHRSTNMFTYKVIT